MFDDGLGAVLVYIGVSPAGAEFNGPPCGDPNGASTTLPDGSVLSISEGPEYTDGRRPDLLVRYATLTRPDGLRSGSQ